MDHLLVVYPSGFWKRSILGPLLLPRFRASALPLHSKSGYSTVLVAVPTTHMVAADSLPLPLPLPKPWIGDFFDTA